MHNGLCTMKINIDTTIFNSYSISITLYETTQKSWFHLVTQPDKKQLLFQYTVSVSDKIIKINVT